jgi:hypothetical protein
MSEGHDSTAPRAATICQRKGSTMSARDSRSRSSGYNGRDWRQWERHYPGAPEVVSVTCPECGADLGEASAGSDCWCVACSRWVPADDEDASGFQPWLTRENRA